MNNIPTEKQRESLKELLDRKYSSYTVNYKKSKDKHILCIADVHHQSEFLELDWLATYHLMVDGKNNRKTYWRDSINYKD